MSKFEIDLSIFLFYFKYSKFENIFGCIKQVNIV